MENQILNISKEKYNINKNIEKIKKFCDKKKIDKDTIDDQAIYFLSLLFIMIVTFYIFKSEILHLFF